MGTGLPFRKHKHPAADDVVAHPKTAKFHRARHISTRPVIENTMFGDQAASHGGTVPFTKNAKQMNPLEATPTPTLHRTRKTVF